MEGGREKEGTKTKAPRKRAPPRTVLVEPPAEYDDPPSDTKPKALKEWASARSDQFWGVDTNDSGELRLIWRPPGSKTATQLSAEHVTIRQMLNTPYALMKLGAHHMSEAGDDDIFESFIDGIDLDAPDAKTLAAAIRFGWTDDEKPFLVHAVAKKFAVAYLKRVAAKDKPKPKPKPKTTPQSKPKSKPKSATADQPASTSTSTSPPKSKSKHKPKHKSQDATIDLPPYASLLDQDDSDDFSFAVGNIDGDALLALEEQMSPSDSDDESSSSLAPDPDSDSDLDESQDDGDLSSSSTSMSTPPPPKKTKTKVAEKRAKPPVERAPPPAKRKRVSNEVHVHTPAPTPAPTPTRVMACIGTRPAYLAVRYAGMPLVVHAAKPLALQLAEHIPPAATTASASAAVATLLANVRASGQHYMWAGTMDLMRTVTGVDAPYAATRANAEGITALITLVLKNSERADAAPIRDAVAGFTAAISIQDTAAQRFFDAHKDIASAIYKACIFALA